MANKTTESELGFLSTLVTELYKRKAERIVYDIDDGMDATIAVDHKFLQAMAKWITDNGVFAAPDADNEASPLANRLKEIQEKSGRRVIDFKAEAQERGQG